MGINKTKGSASPCAELRAAYHDCFNRWYSDKFSKGQWDKEECVSEWDKYRACLAAILCLDADIHSPTAFILQALALKKPAYPAVIRFENKQHLEDKHLRKMLLEAEASPYYVKDDDAERHFHQ